MRTLKKHLLLGLMLCYGHLAWSQSSIHRSFVPGTSDTVYIDSLGYYTDYEIALSSHIHSCTVIYTRPHNFEIEKKNVNYNLSKFFLNPKQKLKKGDTFYIHDIVSIDENGLETNLKSIKIFVK